MLYSIIMPLMIAVLLPAFFMAGFYIGFQKGQNPNKPIIKSKSETTESQKRLETLAKNVANYQGNAEGQEAIK